jgi:PAS domain S-box-containing protein
MSDEDRRVIPSWFGTPSVLAAFHQVLLSNLFDGVYLVDADRRIISWNHAAEALTGYTAQEVVGRLCCDNFLAHVDDNGCKLCQDGCLFTAALKDGQSHESEAYLRHKQGHRVPVSARVVPITDDQGRVLGVAQIFSDVPARSMERRNQELAKLAFRDFLTGLPNRHYTDLKV